jgi:NTP pyrophosphatase (non-canonical NTP hydrolase)
MTFEEYQATSKKTALYPVIGQSFVYPVLGLAGEAGEVAEKVKKIFRDNGGIVDDATRMMIQKELGDVLWYVSQVATEFGLQLDDVATMNVEKLRSRMERGTVHGSGDSR